MAYMGTEVAKWYWIGVVVRLVMIHCLVTLQKLQESQLKPILKRNRINHATFN